MRRRAAFARLGLLALSLAPLTPRTAAAQSSAADVKAAAEELFEQGKRLMGQGKYAEACPKFAESQQLDAGIGTMLYLSDCYEKTGRTASAWALFREAESAARASGQGERARIARERAAALEPKLSRLTVNVNPKTAELSGVAIKRDGSPLTTGLWGSALPVDPGPHTIEATAPGFRKATVKVDVGAGPKGSAVTADVPALEPEGSTPSAPAASSGGGGSVRVDAGGKGAALSTQKMIAIGAGGVGVVGLVVGTFFGLKARSSWNEAQDEHCDGKKCDPQGVKLVDDAKGQATVATLGVGLGVLGLAGGAVLWLTAPKTAEGTTSGWHLAPALGAGTVGAQLGGRW
jgi:hypothetical protein